MRWRVVLLLVCAAMVASAISGSGRAEAEWVASIQRGDAYREGYLYTAAAHEYRRALDLAPDHPIALLRLCDVSLRRGLIDEATAFADRAARAGADPVDVATCRARVADASGQAGLAAEAWSAVAEARPDDRDARIHLIEATIGAHDWTNATALARGMLNAHPDDAAAAFLLGSLLALDDPDQARSILNFADAAPLVAALDEPAGRSDRTYRAVALGRVFLDQDRLALAWRALVEAVSANPAYADAFAYLGITYDRLGDAVLAAAFLDRALELAPDSTVGLYLRGVYLSRHGQWADARADLERAAQIDPDNVAISIGLGRVLIEQGEYAEASGQIGRAMVLDPQNPAWYLALAELHIGRLIEVAEKGVPAARRAVDLSPRDARAHDWLGWGLHLVGEHAQAETELLAALRLDPALARARLHLGSLYIDTGRIEEGRTELQRAVDLDPRGEAGARARQLLGQP